MFFAIRLFVADVSDIRKYQIKGKQQALTVNAKLAVFLFLDRAGVLSLLRSLMGYAGLRSRGYASLHHLPIAGHAYGV